MGLCRKTRSQKQERKVMSEQQDKRRKQKHLQVDREASVAFIHGVTLYIKPKKAIEKQLKLMQNSANLRA